MGGPATLAGAISVAAAVAWLAPGAAHAMTTAECEPAAGAPAGRIALVIGNGAYAGPLARDTPISNARLAYERLCALGFRTTAVADARAAEISRALNAFAERAAAADLAVTYFSGHGHAVADEEYLLGVDYAPARAPTEAGVSVAGFKRAVEKARNAGIAIFDACRTRADRNLAAAYRAGGPADLRSTYKVKVYYSTSSEFESLGTWDGEASRFTGGFFRHLGAAGAKIDDAFAQAVADMGEPPPPSQASPEGAGAPGPGRIVLSPGTDQTAPPPPAPALASGAAAVPGFAELATDYRSSLLYWRLAPGATAPAAGAERDFHEGLRLFATGGQSAFAQARDRFASAAAGGVAEGGTMLAYMLATQRGGDLDMAGAIRTWEAAAAAGSAVAQDSLGVLYRDGLGVDRDHGRAFGFFEQATPRLPAARTDLAYMYYMGLGAERSEAAARVLFKEAATGPGADPSAVYWLGRLQADAPATRDLGLQALERAADLGNPYAQQTLGVGYFWERFPGSRTRALELLQRAAESGYPPAQYSYAQALECLYRAAPEAARLAALKEMYGRSAQGGEAAARVAVARFAYAEVKGGAPRSGVACPAA